MSEPRGRTPNPYDPMRFPPINGPVSPDSQAPPFWPPNPPPNGGRRLIWLLVGLVCALTAIVVALSVTVVGRDRHEIAQSPTPTSAPATSSHRAPFSASAIDGLLPDSGVVSTAVRAPDIGLVAHGDGIATEDPVDADCQGVIGVAPRDYAGSGWTAIRWQQWNSPADLDPAKLWKHVTLSVATYPQADAARAFYTSESSAWRKCNLRIVNSRAASATESPDVLWYVGKVSDSDGVLAATTSNARGNGWTCQSRLTVRNNVVVRVNACGYSDSVAAVQTLLDSITSKVDAAG